MSSEIQAPSKPHMQRHREIQVERLRDKLEEICQHWANAPTPYNREDQFAEYMGRLRVVLDDLEIVRSG